MNGVGILQPPPIRVDHRASIDLPMSDVSYAGPLNQWLAQAPPQPPPRVMGKSPAELLAPYLTDPEQAQAAAEAAARRLRAPYAKANERVSGLPDVGTVLGNKLVNTLMAGPTLMGQVAEGAIDPNSPEGIRRATDVASGTLGWGMLGARPGAAGMAGGKLAQPAAVEPKTGTLSDFITAYHGSPHDFDRFDLSKIGTGEGAQAYGHGLYFAENEGVAKDYRRTLGLKTINNDSPADAAAFWLDEFKGDREAALKYLREAPKNLPAKSAAIEEQTIKHLKDRSESKLGHMYQVAIKAPPEHFLDWDKPLSEQANPKVRDSFEKAMPGRWDQIKDMPAGKAYIDLTQAARDPKTGMSLPTSDVRASKDLREAGIPGIKYLDQGSRAPFGPQTQLVSDKSGQWYVADQAGKRQHGPFQRMDDARSKKSEVDAQAAAEYDAKNKTSNYVVFDDRLIDILKKYGIAGIGALPTMNAYHYQDKGN